jgi:hypothetical protein
MSRCVPEDRNDFELNQIKSKDMTNSNELKREAAAGFWSPVRRKALHHC